MVKLDLKDRKILYELDIDSRQSFSSIGRKVGLSKDFVRYRINHLRDKGIIKNFYTEINFYKLGYSSVKFYLIYQNITPVIKQEVIDFLVKNPYIEVIHSAEGEYHLVLVSIVENIPNFYNIWAGIFNRYRDYFSSQIFLVENMGKRFSKIFLLDEKLDKKIDRTLWLISSDDKKIEIDSLDKRILDVLVSNSRIPTIDIAKKLKSTVITIKSRILKLVKAGFILNYTINIDWYKLGYLWYKTDIVLKDLNKRQQIMDYIEKNPNLIYKFSSLGYVDLELWFCLKNVIQLHHIMDDLTSKFPDAIKNYKYFSIIKTHKYEGVDFWNR